MPTGGGTASPKDFLPLTRADAARRGWKELDIVIVTGDAYVDHPSFGAAVIGRVLERQGYRVGIIAMPDWRDPASMTIFGRPRLFFGVTSGNVDSMLARFTAFKKIRNDDPYCPGGVGGIKPEQAVIKYCNAIKAVYKDVSIVIGGIEASMRRIAHYDYASDKLRRSILEDTRADILAYGMAESAVVEIARRLAAGEGLDGISGTVVMSQGVPPEALVLPREEDVLESQAAFEECYRIFFRHQDHCLAQPAGNRHIVHYPPPHLSGENLDETFALPYCYAPHTAYAEPIPAFEMIRDSITAHRGCVSGCSFCSVALHQGRRIIARTPYGIREELKRRVRLPGFKGHITDIGGPSANMYGYLCRQDWRCRRESCTAPALCPNLIIRTAPWVEILEGAAGIPGARHVTIGSGIRYDLLMCDPDRKAVLKHLVAHHVSGQLKIAPEHTVPRVLAAMRKTPVADLEEFVRLYRATTAACGRRQYLLPYLMACHPGCRLEDMELMRKDIRRIFGFLPRQVQSFIPLPLTLSSAVYLTGVDPLTSERYVVERTQTRRQAQHHVFFSQSKQDSSRRLLVR